MSVHSSESELLNKLGEAARIEIRPEEFDGLLDGLRELRTFFAWLNGAGNIGETGKAAATAEAGEIPGNFSAGPREIPGNISRRYCFDPLPLKTVRAQLDSGKISPKELKQLCLERISRVNPELNAFLCVEDSKSEKQAEPSAPAAGNVLSGVPCAVKDNICVAEFPMTCGSAFLRDFRPEYDAEAVSGLKTAGAELLGKTNLDEFAMGSSGELSAYGRVDNPAAPGYMAGGSSAGSAAAVAAGLCTFALGSDTGGSVRLPASFCGISGLKPTYGRVSRYGLTAFASSTDCIGILGNNAEDLSVILENISGGEAISRDRSRRRFGNAGKYSHAREFKEDREIFAGMKLAVPDRLLSSAGLSKDVQKAFENALEILGKLGFRLGNIDIGDADRQLAAYSVITSGEASSNLARFDGLRYGVKAGNTRISGFGQEIPENISRNGSNDDIADYGTFFTRNRTHGFGPEVKRRILFGTYALSAGKRYEAYDRAMLFRQELISRRREIFREYAGIITPAALAAACPAGSLTPEMMHRQDLLTVGASLAGTPAVSVPMQPSRENLPQGLQLECGWMQEGMLLSIAAAFERELKGQ